MVTTIAVVTVVLSAMPVLAVLSYDILLFQS